jgi:hypothetical protein
MRDHAAVPRSRRSCLRVVALLAVALCPGCGGEDSQPDAALTRETEHFRLYGMTGVNASVMDDLAAAYESAYAKVTTDLRQTLSARVSVTVYATQDAFIAATGGYVGPPEDRPYHTGMAGPSGIYQVAPGAPGIAFTYEEQTRITAHHELTHMVVAALAPGVSVPRWLNEGVAQYEGLASPITWVAHIVTSGLSREPVPTFRELDTDLGTFRARDGYEWAYTLACYMIERHGFEAVIALIRAPGRYEEAFGLSEDELYADWVEFLRENYR